MKDATRIGIAIVQHAQRVLVGVRTSDQVLAGKAEFPGGKCEPGEAAQACAIRECFEETALTVQATRLLHRVEHRYEHGCVDLHFFLCQLVDLDTDEPPVAADGFRWIPKSELTELEFPEANRSAIQLLLET